MTCACERVWEAGPGFVVELDRRLRSERWRIFRRLRQHLYARRPDEQTKPWIREEIVNHPDYGRWQHHYEFQRMVRIAIETFGCDLLTEDELTTILDTILSGPVREDFRWYGDDDDTDERFDQHRRQFHRMQLRPFRQILSGECLDYFLELDRESQNPMEDDNYLLVGAGTSGIVRAQSPASAENLAMLGDEELLAYINE